MGTGLWRNSCHMSEKSAAGFISLQNIHSFLNEGHESNVVNEPAGYFFHPEVVLWFET